MWVVPLLRHTQNGSKAIMLRRISGGRITAEGRKTNGMKYATKATAMSGRVDGHMVLTSSKTRTCRGAAIALGVEKTLCGRCAMTQPVPHTCPGKHTTCFLLSDF